MENCRLRRWFAWLDFRIDRNFHGLIAFVVFAAATPGSGVAQVAFESPVDRKTGSSGLDVTPSVQMMYDDNIFRANPERVPAVDDIIVTPGVIALFDKPVGLHQLELKGIGRYDYYTRQTSRSRLAVEGTAAARISLWGICRAEPYARFRSARADYGDINGSVDNNQKFSTLSLQLSCPREAGLYPLAKVERETTKNDPLFAYSNRDSKGYAIGVGYSRPSLGDLSLYYSFLDTNRYDIGVVNKVNRYGLTFKRSIVSHFSTALDVHWLDVDSNVANIAAYHGLAWNVTTTIRPLSTIVLRLETGRSIVTDSLVATGYAIRSNYLGTLRYQLANRASARIGYEYETRAFRRNPALAFDTIDSDRIYTLSGGIERALSSKVNVVLSGLHVKRQTSNGTNEYDANQVTLGLTYGF